MNTKRIFVLVVVDTITLISCAKPPEIQYYRELLGVIRAIEIELQQSGYDPAGVDQYFYSYLIDFLENNKNYRGYQSYTCANLLNQWINGNIPMKDSSPGVYIALMGYYTTLHEDKPIENEMKRFHISIDSVEVDKIAREMIKSSKQDH